MKKFTKWCLITALVLFITGCAFCGVFGSLGGFEEIDRDNRLSKIYSMGWYGLRWGFDWDDGWLNFGFMDDIDDIDDFGEHHSGAQNIASTSGMEQTNYTSEDFTDIDIELGGANLIIQESADDHIYIKNESSIKTIKYGVENSTFRLYSSGKAFGNISPKGNVYLQLPGNMNLISIDIEIAAGNMENISMEADTIEIEAGAGKLSIDGMTARIISIDIGAGEMTIGSMSADTVDISVGAGTVNAKDVDIRDIDLEVGMGNLEIQGKIAGNADVECGMGGISMTLQGTEKEHNYELDCAMGNVKIGDSSYGGIAAERYIDNKSASSFNIECATGNITIEFED